MNILTQAGASVDLQDEFGNTPLKYAHLSHRRSIAQLLRRQVNLITSSKEGGGGEGGEGGDSASSSPESVI